MLIFNNTLEFREYIKSNKFKIKVGTIPKEDDKLLKHHQIDTYKFIQTENCQKQRLLPYKRKKVLPSLYRIAMYLVNQERTLALIPLNSLIREINNWKLDIDSLYNDMQYDGRSFIYWNKDYMLYDDEEQNIETISIQRKYLGSIKDQKVEELGDESRIVVLGTDNTKRTINKEAKKYFEDDGYKVEFTQKLSYNGEYPDGVIINFVENKEVRKVLKKEDLKKIKKYGKAERIYQLSLTGFPDLFVWDNKGDYFFVEVKSEKDKLHLSQYEWIKWNKRIGNFNFKILRILPK